MSEPTSGNGTNQQLERLISQLDKPIAETLNQALEGADISVKQATELFETTGLEFNALQLAADTLRRQTVGDVVTFVINRNVNFTNVCIKRCGFCAFSRDFR